LQERQGDTACPRAGREISSITQLLRSCRRASKLSERSTRRLSCSRYWIISPQESCEKLSEKTRHPISEARASVRRRGPDLDGNLAALPQTRSAERTQTGEFICVRFFASAMPILGRAVPGCQNPVGDTRRRLDATTNLNRTAAAAGRSMLLSHHR